MQTSVTSVITWVAAVVALAVAVILPAGHFLLGYTALRGELHAEAQLRSDVLSKFIGSNPEMWRFDRHHIEELLSRAPQLRADQSNRLLAHDGRLIAQMGVPPRTPCTIVRTAVFDAGVRTGEIQISRSTLPLWQQTAVAGLLGLLLGSAVFVVLRVLPLRALRAAMKALNEEVRRHAEARREADAANRAKSMFLAAASHDLRQPLHALGLYAAVLDEKVDEPEVRQLTRSINTSVDALENLFSEIMDISKLDAGVLHAHVTTFRIDAVLDRVRAEFDEPARAKGLKLKVQSCPSLVQSDAVLLQRIVNNLVANAVRYTERGRILVGCRRRGPRLRIEVRDTGIGIAPTELSRIFDEFYQVGNLERDRSKGLGLGLAIVRRLGDLLHHRIFVRSRPGHGSCFAIELPFEAACDPAANEVAADDVAASIEDKVVLVIDDEPSVRDGMEILLNQWQCRPIAAASLQDALDELDRLAIAPDVIIADYRLRESVGTEAIEVLRQRYGADLPAVVITGDISPERLAEFEASGYQHLHKPVPPARLRSLLASLLDSR